MKSVKYIFLIAMLLLVLLAMKDEFLSRSYIIKSSIAGVIWIGLVILLVKEYKDKYKDR